MEFIYLVIFLLVIIVWGYLDYRKLMVERLNVQASFLSVDTIYGEVAYLDLGVKGNSVVLFMVGGGVGIDASLSFDWLVNSGYRVIAINRPGYYNLPVDVVDSIAEQAALYHAVLQQLGIDEVIVFGVSMGGLSALYYAQAYPIRALVLWSAVSGQYAPNQASVDSMLGRLVMGNRMKDVISWLMVRSTQLFPKMTIRSLLKSESTLNQLEIKELIEYLLASNEGLDNLLNFIKAMTPMSKLYWGMMDEIDKASLPSTMQWSKIKAPVFAVSSTCDKDVGFEHFQRLMDNLPNMQSMVVKAGGHFVWWGREGEDVIKNTLAFLNKTLG